jgi:threonine synthase
MGPPKVVTHSQMLERFFAFLTSNQKAFKDVALQCLGNLFEYFLLRKNQGKENGDREHLTVVGATSGDTGSAAIYGLRNKLDLSVFIMFPTGKVSPIQEAQMTTVLDANVHNLSVDGTFDDCQVSQPAALSLLPPSPLAFPS